MLSQTEIIIAVAFLIVVLAVGHAGGGVLRFQFLLRARGAVEVKVAPRLNDYEPSELHDVVHKVLLRLESIEAKVERLIDRVS